MKMVVFGVAFVLLTSLVFQAKVDGSLVLDNNEFFIYNKMKHKARLTLYKTGWDEFGTYEHELADNQLWLLEPNPNKEGCYYMVNERHSQYRFADSKKNGLIAYKGNYFEDQLWRFVPSGENDGYYYIKSCVYTNDKMTKFAVKNRDVRLYKGNDKNDGQLWKLVPRFEVEMKTDDVFHFDNRQGSTPITREVTVTTGVTRSTTGTIRSQLTYKQSMTASISAAGASAGSTAEFTAELETSFSETNEESWSKTETIIFTIPAGKNFKVMQHEVDFKGTIPADSCTLLTSIKIFESDSATFTDPDNFIIKS